MKQGCVLARNLTLLQKLDAFDSESDGEEDRKFLEAFISTSTKYRCGACG